ncbi:hypothetical protein S245_040515, partial [Arachis hypogaea]
DVVNQAPIGILKMMPTLILNSLDLPKHFPQSTFSISHFYFFIFLVLFQICYPGIITQTLCTTLRTRCGVHMNQRVSFWFGNKRGSDLEAAFALWHWRSKWR